ncbi:MAG: DUF4956 domain-containing protein [Crocinitomicaceae bacterium]|jgi:hypothetical protein|nr:DUF4956 domain-containing protein [Crocinitomicaceae bacterium]MDG1742384.1 DUF4956 domain-containing protein [Crocinitomicaceae bacterium]
MLLKIPTDNTGSDLFDLILFNEDVYMLIFRLLINLFFMTLIIRFLYYPISKRKDYLFSYYLIGIIIFFLCFGLKKMEIDNGMGFALFAIFGIIRYRTDAIEIKEMTYLFLIIGMSVINSLASNKVSIAEMAIVNMSLVAITYGLERVWLLKHETRKTVVYERIDLIQPDRMEEMKSDLEMRTGLNINRVEVGKIDFLNDTAQVRIYYFDDDQAFSDYSK